MGTAPATDGRARRSQRTRLAVVDALLALLREGNPRPTAREIAERAKVSLRSVYVHFDDLEDLFCAAATRQGELVSGMLVEVPATGPLETRADSLMRVRGRIYEEVGGVMRAAELQEPFSAALRDLLANVRAASRADLARVFARELEPMPSDARARRLAVLDAVTSRRGWEQLRGPGGLDEVVAHRATVEAIVALLGACA